MLLNRTTETVSIQRFIAKNFGWKDFWDDDSIVCFSKKREWDLSFFSIDEKLFGQKREINLSFFLNKGIWTIPWKKKIPLALENYRFSYSLRSSNQIYVIARSDWSRVHFKVSREIIFTITFSTENAKNEETQETTNSCHANLHVRKTKKVVDDVVTVIAKSLSHPNRRELEQQAYKREEQLGERRTGFPRWIGQHHRPRGKGRVEMPNSRGSRKRQGCSSRWNATTAAHSFISVVGGQLNADFPPGQSPIPSNRNIVPSVYTMYILYTGYRVDEDRKRERGGRAGGKRGLWLDFNLRAFARGPRPSLTRPNLRPSRVF